MIWGIAFRFIYIFFKITCLKGLYRKNYRGIVSFTHVSDLCLCLVTSTLLCHWWKFWWLIWTVHYVIVILSIISIKNAKQKLKNCNRSKSEILMLLWDIVIFRLVAYLLNMICLILRTSYKISYIYVLV